MPTSPIPTFAQDFTPNNHNDEDRNDKLNQLSDPLIESLLTSPRLSKFAARTETFTIFTSPAVDLRPRGKDLTDAWIAAIALDLDATLVIYPSNKSGVFANRHNLRDEQST